MQTSVTRRGQTVIPSHIRKRHNIQSGDKLVWIDDGEAIKVVPVPGNSFKALRGIGKGENLVAKLLGERQVDRDREA